MQGTTRQESAVGLLLTAIVLPTGGYRTTSKGMNSLSCSIHCRTEQNAGNQLSIHLVQWEKMWYWNGQSLFLRVVNKKQKEIDNSLCGM